MTDDYGLPISPQYKVIKKSFDWYLLYDQMQAGEAVRHEFRVVRIAHDIALYPQITLDEAIKQFDELVDNDYT